MKRLDLDLTRGDIDHFNDTVDKVVKFDIDNPEMQIGVDTILQSAKNRALLRAMADRGLVVPKKLAPRLSEFIRSSRPE